MKYLIIILIMFILSCSSLETLKSGRYKVEHITGNYIKLNGLASSWYIPNDTLKVGDSITIINIQRKR